MAGKKKVLGIRALEGAVAARIKFLKEVTDFALSVCREYGEVRFHALCLGDPYDQYDLRNFGGFSFRIETGRKSNRVRIWWHSYRQDGDGLPLVLDFQWTNDIGKYQKECTSVDSLALDQFGEGEWQEKILNVIQNRISISEEFEKNRVKKKIEKEEPLGKEERQQLLEEKAKRLRIML